ncbi:uncharacterized protein PRCAT00006130001 [Priceomyces carsonii]|uniref:uncharacterized protein n=1 Tax=Priceomyces carsonii TaxID=28549 RepID=UPI002ED791E2|nr:unnamed protein product [Priceomyces carsonii]
MLRLSGLRGIFKQRVSRAEELLSWSIKNPGWENTYISSLKSQFIPIFGVLGKIILKHGQKLNGVQSSKRSSSSTRRKRNDSNVINPRIMAYKYTKTEPLVNNDLSKTAFLTYILELKMFSDNDIEYITTNFLNLFDLVGSFSSPQVVDFICQIWAEVFTKDRSIESVHHLQDNFLRHRRALTHLLINYRAYDLYEKVMEPLLRNPEQYGFTESWCDTLAKTLRFKNDSYGVLSFNNNGISKFLKDESIEVDTRRKLLAIFLRKGLLYSNDVNEKYSITKYYIEHLRDLNDDDFFFMDQKYSVYNKSLRLINSISQSLPDHLDRLRAIMLSSSIKEKTSFLNFMTSTMIAILPYAPSNCLKYWEYKHEIYEKYNKTRNNVLNYMDLKCAMISLCELNLPLEALALYQRFPQLHHEVQIEVLLRISDSMKDYKLLQNQFEDMYGKGQLPHVIHYSIVMNALSIIGAIEKVDQLYHQLQKRNLQPSAEIYAALIKSRLHKGNIEDAKNWIRIYEDGVEKGEVDEPVSGSFCNLLIDYYMKSSDYESAKQLFDSIIEKGQDNLLNSDILCKLINFAATSYRIGEVERIKSIALQKNLVSESFYIELIRAYIRLDQYERADAIVFEAHSYSDVPFSSAEIYKSQLRNYRFWFRVARSEQVRRMILKRADFIISRIDDQKISLRKNHGLYNECIKFFIAKNDLARARVYLKEAKNHDVITEHHFTPLLKHYSNLGNFESNSKILDLYREMVRENIQVTTNTYVYLMKALLQLDVQNQNGYKNSYELLKSVFELNGLSISPTAENKGNDYDLSDSSVQLCRIVSEYVTATAQNNNSSLDLLVSFLGQIKRRLGSKLTTEFKFVLYTEMGRLYQKQGNLKLGENLVSSGLEELSHTISKYVEEYPFLDDEIRVPTKLQLEYRSLFDLKLTSMRSSSRGPHEYLNSLNKASNCRVRLSGYQYSRLISEILKLSNKEVLPIVLSVCEEYLVSGNWVESKIMRKLQYLYKLLILYYVRTVGSDFVKESFGILNRYYNVRDLHALEKEFKNISNPLAALKKELDVYNHLVYKTSQWSIDDLLNYIPEFFVPERHIPTQNKISPSLLSEIWRLFSKFSKNDQMYAFKLMDEFPETVEYLLYNGPARLRLVAFRAEVDKIEPPPKSDQQEDVESRYDRAIRALKYLKRESITV